LMPAAQRQRRIVAQYDYQDEKGQLIYQVVRYEPKDFRQRAPDGKGGWTWTTKNVRRVPYRLPELLAADPVGPVFIVEGEKDADRLAGLGLVATTNVGGAGNWRPAYGQHLAGRHVVVLPDNDEPGQQHAADLVRHLAGVAASIKLIELPGLREKGDVSDWLDAGRSRGVLLALVQRTPALPISVIK
jgi:hypothetical protein